MKKLQLSFFFLISLSSINSIAQELKNSELSESKFRSFEQYNFKSYVSKDGFAYKIGDRLKIGTPSSNKTFAFINVDSFSSSESGALRISSSGDETEIKKIYVRGSKRAGFSVYFRTKGFSGFSNYIIDIENAIAAGEIKSFGMTSDEALNNLKRAKDKLDLGLITQTKYDSIKVELVKYIK